MSKEEILERLVTQEIIVAKQASFIRDDDRKHPFSIHWELKTILYAGISLLSSGLGILIYLNIDQISHQAIVAAISALTIACFAYCFRKHQPFSRYENTNPLLFVDFSLLLGCLTFITLEGYLQFQYKFFGDQYDIATIIPAILFAFLAYYFDHKGVLSMAITAFASYLGLKIAPLNLIQSGQFSSRNIAITAILFGLTLILLGILSEKKDFKKHFSFTYLTLGGNLAFGALLYQLFSADLKLLYFIFISGMSYGFIWYARKNLSYLFLLMGVIYGYIGFTYSLFYYVPTEIGLILTYFYFIASSLCVIIFLLKIKEILGVKKHESL
ncbi:Predicted membrane protein [Pseudarcicella hirudinis]|uniref:Predicted membrane protein n=1 Tax=Pseudarcicella hirudinis TaxID=1079859 RepID=A0A1I5S2F0_9BACT|nr:DUF2157 domain-containing protein [Pseudarcicella hirudinis]SFP64436.1 Predicted membrane protein [Pseudarcicella hirudinis]